MKRIAIVAAACVVLGTVGCSQTATSSGTSDPSQSVSSTADESTSESPSPTGSKSSTSPQSSATASQVAANLGCDNIASQTPVGTTPKATTMVKCTLGDQGYNVLAFDSAAAVTVAVRSLQAQAAGSGETMTIARSTKWIVKAAEGPTIGAPMVKAAAKQGGAKVILS